MRKKTTEEFIEEMFISHPNIEIKGTYFNNKTPIECQCKICSHIWNPRPDQLVRGQGCPICGLKKRIITQSKNHNDFIREMYLVNPKIKIISQYINNSTIIKVQCLDYETVWEVTPNNLLRGSGCPNCNGHILKTQLEYEEDMKRIHPSIKVLGTYINNKIPVEVLCKKCGNIWYSYPTNAIYKNHGCPKCEKRYKGEVRIERYLNDKNVSFETQKSYDDLLGVGGRKLRYDFYLPDYNLLIEYQGEFHDGSSFVGDFFTEERLKVQKEHDERKRNYAKNKNIFLLEIWYYDFDNIETILETKLKEIQHI